MRTAEKKRKTKETEIVISLELDGSGKHSIQTGVPFFDHMLSLFAQHGLFDLNIEAKGDIQIDYHHTVEDVGIVLGEVFKQALGDKKGIVRYGFFTLPMDEALATAIIDISGRPHLSYSSQIPSGKVGDFDAELIEEFFKAFSNAAGITLHIQQNSGSNIHHQAEAIFKSFGRALDIATKIDQRVQGVPSTKGVL